MTSNAYFENEQRLIEAELAALGPPQRSALVGGDKKVGTMYIHTYNIHTCRWTVAKRVPFSTK